MAIRPASIIRAFTISAAVVLVGVFSAPISPAVAAPSLRVKYTDVAVAGAHDTHVTAVNLSGVIAGWYGDDPDGATTHGFTATRRGSATTVTPVEVAGATRTIVTSLNDNGTISGAYWTGDGVEHGFIQTSDGALTTLDDPACLGVTGCRTVASQVNNSGTVVGYFGAPNPVPDTVPTAYLHGFMWTSSAGYTTYDAPSPTPNATVSTQLFGINNLGDMVGAYTYNVGPDIGPDTRNRGFELSSAGTFTEIVDPAPIVSTNACGWTEPHAINDSGGIVGDSGNGCSGLTDAWLLTSPTSTFTYLAYKTARDTAQVTVASSINNNGIIGGTWGNGIGISHGYTATTH